MRLVPLALLLAVFGTPLGAEDVRVLSGEHADFSRIVLVFERDIGWTENRTPDGLSVLFDRKGIDLDLARVFQKIPRDRIVNVGFDTERSVLTLGLKDGSTAKVFWASDKALAIDVMEPSNQEEDRGAYLNVEMLRPAQADLSTSSGSGALRRLKVAPANLQTEAETRGHALPASEVFRKRLIEGLSRTATFGFVDLDDDPKVGSSSGISDAREGIGTHALATGPLERSLRRLWNDAGDLGKQTRACPDFGFLKAEGGEGDWMDTIAMARSAEFAEWGSDSSTYAVDLAKAYLEAGFGSEAKAVLKAWGSPEPDTDYLTILADAVEGHPLSVRGKDLERYSGCEGVTDLLRLLAVSDEEAVSLDTRQEVLSTFRKLNNVVQGQLARPLAAKFASMGGGDEASLVMRIAGLSGNTDTGVNGPIFETDGSLTTSMGTPHDAGDPGNGDAANVRDLVRRLTLGGAVEIEVDQVVLAEAMAHERKGTPQARELLDAAAIGSARLGDLSTALRIWSSATDSPRKDSVFSKIAENVMASENAVALLALFGGSSADDRFRRLDLRTATAVVRRLLDIGFPEVAASLLATRSDFDRRDQRHLEAESALVSGDARLALSLVAGDSDPEGTDLRVRAKSLLGEPVNASEKVEDIGALDEAVTETSSTGIGARTPDAASESEVVGGNATDRKEPGIDDVELGTSTGRVTLNLAETVLSDSRDVANAVHELLAETVD